MNLRVDTKTEQVIKLNLIVNFAFCAADNIDSIYRFASWYLNTEVGVLLNYSINSDWFRNY